MSTGQEIGNLTTPKGPCGGLGSRISRHPRQVNK
jgi:hypothetical protein